MKMLKSRQLQQLLVPGPGEGEACQGRRHGVAGHGGDGHEEHRRG